MPYIEALPGSNTFASVWGSNESTKNVVMSRVKLSRRAAVSLLARRAACLSIVLLAWNGTVLRLARCVAQNAKTVEISLDQIISNNTLEPGTLLNGLGGLQVGPFAYDLAPYVHRNFTVDWQEQRP